MDTISTAQWLVPFGDMADTKIMTYLQVLYNNTVEFEIIPGKGSKVRARTQLEKICDLDPVAKIKIFI